ncbi:MAG: prephenate dehydratase [Lachnospiraceae bacterium]|jgi:chorismate mutase/prephenate dehydratase|nr:prephenate dehydratase [Lachnospiraceae bacterium]
MIRDLNDSRKEIDEIDKNIVSLFERRMQVANDIAKYKKSTGRKVYDPEREEQKLLTLTGLTDSGFGKLAVDDLFRQIMSISRKYQYQELGSQLPDIPLRVVDKLDYDKDTKVCFFGDRGSYSEQAMLEFFSSGVDPYNKTTFAEVISEVENFNAKYGVIPIENTSTGGISDIYDLLADARVTIVAEHVVKVEHALLGLPGAKTEQIRKAYSHPQGIMQCDEFLKSHPYIEPVKYLSTAGAARLVRESDDPSLAAIGSMRAAEVYGLIPLAEKINTQDSNYTRFIIISNQQVYQRNANKLSLTFEIRHKAGSLYNILANFYYNNLNMTKIESRPIPGRNWEYRFFVDVEGNISDPAVNNCLAGLKEGAGSLRILGNIVTR